MTVRSARAEDVPALLRLLAEMHAESIYRDVPLDPAKLRLILEHALKNPRYCAFVDDHAGAIGGVYLGKVSAYFFSDELAGYDVAFYVSPGRRGSTAAVRLLRAFERWAADQGAKRIWPAISSGIHPDRSARLYTGSDFTPVGAIFTGRPRPA